MTAQQNFFDSIVTTEKPEETLIEKFAKERTEWLDKVKDMSSQMKKVSDIPELMTNVYTERQRCVEYYHYLISKLILINKLYRKSYADRLDFWTFQSQIRYPNESAKNNKILTELAELVEKRELIESHAKYILETKNSIDNVIYGVSKRVDIEKMINGG